MEKKQNSADDEIQVPEEVLPRFASSSWTIPPEALSATSRAQVRILPRSKIMVWKENELTVRKQSAKMTSSACSSPNAKPED